ncbi:MAG TPA: SURF1 family protein [Oceanospirillaceae bacterium]|nr:SURF1 family protein [Oceanospirillaceae bacterium]
MTVVTKVRHHWALSVFTLFFLPLTLVLGVWQLDRAQQKDELALSLAALEQALHKAPGDSLTALVDYQRVTLNAQFIKPYVWFRDNQVVKGKVGYDAIGVVAVGPELLLVNRGWFASNGQRNPLPSMQWPKGNVTLTGRLVPNTANPYQLAADVYTSDYPQLVQALDLPQLQQQFKLPLLPWVLMLDAGQQHDLCKTFGLCVAMVWPSFNPLFTIYLSSILFAITLVKDIKKIIKGP